MFEEALDEKRICEAAAHLTGRNLDDICQLWANTVQNSLDTSHALLDFLIALGPERIAG